MFYFAPYKFSAGTSSVGSFAVSMSNMSGTGKVFPRSRTGTEKRNEKMKKELKKNKKRNQQNNMTKPSGSNFLPEKFSRSCGLNALTGPGIRGPVIVANHSPRSVRLGRFPQIFLFPRLLSIQYTLQYEKTSCTLHLVTTVCRSRGCFQLVMCRTLPWALRPLRALL